jgi:hypothetical protein
MSHSSLHRRDRGRNLPAGTGCGRYVGCDRRFTAPAQRTSFENFAVNLPGSAVNHLHVGVLHSILVRCVGGPDAGWSVRLPTGSHWLGRVDGGLCVRDPAIEAHHAHTIVDQVGRLALLQTAGRCPILVDGRPVRGWTSLSSGSVVEVGATRLEIGSPACAGSPLVEWIFEPQDTTSTELARFARDVQFAADTAVRRALAEPDGRIEIGVAEIDVEIDIRRADGEVVSLGELDHAAQAVVERGARRSIPYRIALNAGSPVAIVASDPTAVADALTAQLTAHERARAIVTDATEAESLAGSGRPMIVLATNLVDVPPCCRSVLEVGATWRATWCDDIVDHPDRTFRLHARGRPRGSTDAGRPLVAEEVARPRPELGRDVARIPQPARRQ